MWPRRWMRFPCLKNCDTALEGVLHVRTERHILILSVILLIILAITQVNAEERGLVAEKDWTAPDLSAVDIESEPWLLVLKIAQEEVGYIEGPRNYSKYGEWFGTPRCQWCAEFLTWCVGQADERYGTHLLRDIYPYYGQTTGANWFAVQSRFVSSSGKMPLNKQKQWWPETGEYLKNNEYIPYPGDYFWLYIPDYGNKTTHVGIVEGVSRDEQGEIVIHAIEGNNPDRVQRATYLLSDRHIYGFGTPMKRMETEMTLYNHSVDVVQAKMWLSDLGYYKNSDMTDTYTEVLVKAIKKFQKANSISASGNINIETWLVLKKAVGAQ